MNARVAVLLCLMPLFAACVSDPVAEQKQATERMAHKIQVYGPACEALGYENDTDAWRECIQREYEQLLLRQQPVYPPYSPYFGPYYNYRPCYPAKGGVRCF